MVYKYLIHKNLFERDKFAPSKAPNIEYFRTLSLHPYCELPFLPGESWTDQTFKKGDLAGSQLLEGDARKEGLPFSEGIAVFTSKLN